MTTRRTGDPWMPAGDYGRSLPRFCVNLLVRNVPAAVAFYRDVMGAVPRYHDADFAALALHGEELMLHADHTYERHPWHAALAAGDPRGVGAELRLFGLDPDSLAARARAHDATIVAEPSDKPHGWREVWLADPDGYVWAVGVPITP